MGANCTTERGCTKDGSYHWSTHTSVTILSDGDDLNFSALSDDIILLILSFVSYAPMELRTTQLANSAASKEVQKRAKREQWEIDRLVKDYNRHAQKINKSQGGASRRLLNPVPYRNIIRVKNTERSKFGSLTHVFPLVNHRTRALCLSSDIVWKEALIRLCSVNEEKSNLWLRGLRFFVDKIRVEANPSASEINEHIVDQDVDANSLVLEACRLSEIVLSARDDLPVTETSTSTRRDERNNDESKSVARNVFRQILCDGHVLKRLPLFHMTGHIPSNTGESWHFHEPRYRILIDQVMSGRSDRDREGRPIIRKPRPRFAYSFQSVDSIQNNVACIVDITRCRMYSDGAADVVVMPMVLIEIKELEEQENGQGLVNAIYREIQND